MKRLLKQQLRQALLSLLTVTRLPPQKVPKEIQIEKSRHPGHGDFSSNLALTLARHTNCTPLVLAEHIAQAIRNLPGLPHVEQVAVAKPGFINFFLSPQAYLGTVLEILQQQEKYGDLELGAGQTILLEFVSANPTGPLHIGHGRGAALGATLAKLLRKAGYQVDCEYYVNDAGRQIDILTVSAWLRYLTVLGTKIDFPPLAYQGDYLLDIARHLQALHGKRFALPTGIMLPETRDDEEKHLDRLIHFAKVQLGETQYHIILKQALDHTLEDIKTDLQRFGIEYQHWFSERSMLHSTTVQDVLTRLGEGGHGYTRDGALWFSASRFGDKKDRVLVRQNGHTTYFAMDIAYHLNKFARGYDRLINIWGADHHGYVPRLKAALQALGGTLHQRIDIVLVQFASLYRGKEKLPMSTRSGHYVTLKTLCEEISVDAARVFYSMRKAEQHLNFDLELAQSKSNENPLYYIQYAHARICSVFRKVRHSHSQYQTAQDLNELLPLGEDAEQRLARRLAEYPERIEAAARQYEPHQIVHYLRAVADDFHCYYDAHPFQVPDQQLQKARLSLILACKILLANGLALLGATAPEEM